MVFQIPNKPLLISGFLSVCCTVGLLLIFPLNVYRAKLDAPTWESLDSRPLPKWYDEAKFGIFIHWGVYSVPSFMNEWFWKWMEGNSTIQALFMKRNYPRRFAYQDFARDFSAEFYDPDEWADIFKNSGARYVVLTSKHHDGYTLWPSKYSFSWNSMIVGPRRDLVGELAGSIRSKTNLKFGLYYSLYEWFNPLYLQDKKNQYATQLYVTQHVVPQLHEIVKDYKPDVIWSDGDWEAPDSYWLSKEFLAWLYHESPVRDYVVVNDRWGKQVLCKHGDFRTCKDNFKPDVLQPHKWESCTTIDKYSWGYRRNAKLSEIKSTRELLKHLVSTVSRGGNMLLNVGPTKEGVIPVIMQERLHDIGYWLRINGEAIYSTTPWIIQQEMYSDNIFYTLAQKEQFLYAIVLEWPKKGLLTLAAPQLSNDSTINMLGTNFTLKWHNNNVGIEISFPDRAKSPNFAWCLKMSNVNIKVTNQNNI